MTPFQAAVLGTVQGLTEFLPISSSGHLVLFEQFFGLQSSSLHFEVAVHVATLLAVLIYFFSDIKKLRINDFVILAIGTIPAVFFGLFLKDVIEKAFSSLTEVSIEFFISGILMFIAQRQLDKPIDQDKQLKKISPQHSLLIGIAQAIAIFPAISRSGATVATGLLLKIDREATFRFSFLLSIPAILGASVLSLIDILQEGISPSESLLTFGIGSVFAFVFGMLSLIWFRKVMQSAQLKYFGVYCCALSVILLTYQFLS